MKKLFIILFCLINYPISAQIVGDSFSYIKEKEQGEFYSTGEKEYPYLYTVHLKEIDSDIVYFFDNNFICTYETIHPNTSIFAKMWIHSFNQKWTLTHENRWEYIKDDGKTLICELTIMENKYFLFDNDFYAFYIKEKNK